jgi:hypothetical protein
MSKYLGEAGVKAARQPWVYRDREAQTKIIASVAGMEQADYMVDANHKRLSAQSLQNQVDAQTAEKTAIEGMNNVPAKMATNILGPLTPLRAEIEKARIAGKFTPEQVQTWGAQLDILHQQASEGIDAYLNTPRQEFQGKSLSVLMADPAKIDKFKNMVSPTICIHERIFN